MSTPCSPAASLPAGALATPHALDGLAPLLERLEQRDAPLFIHPGPGLHERSPESSLSDPLWWSALTRYVTQMQAAWLSFVTVGRRDHPRLRILFAMLAGGAPLLAERLLARGGPRVDLRDPLTFYDTSSFGPDAITALSALVGAEQLLYGSDRPVVEPVVRAREALAGSAGRLLAAEALAL
jgi:6-methylsalicylate decarboxylase